MAKTILIEQLHVSVFVPRSLPEPECQAIRKTLDGSQFRRHLIHAVRDIFRGHKALQKAKVEITH